MVIPSSSMTVFAYIHICFCKPDDDETSVGSGGFEAG